MGVFVIVYVYVVGGCYCYLCMWKCVYMVANVGCANHCVLYVPRLHIFTPKCFVHVMSPMTYTPPHPPTQPPPQKFAASMKHGSNSLAHILESFRSAADLDNRYTLCHQDSVLTLARLLDQVNGMSLKDRYTFCQAPVNTRDKELLQHMQLYAMKFAQGRPVTFDAKLPSGLPRNHQELLLYENAHKVWW